MNKRDSFFISFGKALWNGTLVFQRAIMFITSALVIIIMNLVVILRYIFKTDLYGMEEIIVMIGIWLYFMGASYASYRRCQISADFLSMYLKKEEHRKLHRIIVSFITAAICLMATSWAFDFFIWGLSYRPVSSIYRIPLVIPQSSIFLCFVLMSIYSITHIINDIHAYKILKKSSS